MVLSISNNVLTLVHYRLESYDFRAQEKWYNDRLPQYRINLEIPSTTRPDPEILRMHYVHRQSTHEDAIPLLFCYDMGSSFIEVARIIDALSEPVTTPPIGNLGVQAFHVVCPSIPGFGFSDTSQDGDFGLKGTADAFQALMQRLGYRNYVTHGTGW